jgi:hypothetical protein
MSEPAPPPEVPAPDPGRPYRGKLTETPGRIEPADTEKLHDAGWSEQAIWEITALVSFFNFSGRLAAASGLPPDEIPADSRFKEAQGG